jgi:hypothetical protein
MVRPEDVTFKTISAEVQNVATGDTQQPMDIVEIKMPDGNISAFPATDRNPESGQRYSEIYATKYQAFKNGEPDPDRVAVLEREVRERQDELKAMREAKPRRAQDDERVQENLGYGKTPDVKSERAAAATADPRATSTQRAELAPNAPLGPVPALQKAGGPKAGAQKPAVQKRDSPKKKR